MEVKEGVKVDDRLAAELMMADALPSVIVTSFLTSMSAAN